MFLKLLFPTEELKFLSTVFQSSIGTSNECAFLAIVIFLVGKLAMMVNW